MNDLISVVVPIYKVEKYLPKCIDSILAQTYTNIEVILVDDGSPDGCGRIADDYAAKDNRVRVIHKTNGGLSSARNAGIDIAKGAYIGFVDSDDYIDAKMYEKLYVAIKTSDADMAICNYVWVNEDATMYGDNLLVNSTIPTTVMNCEEALAKLVSFSAEYVTAVNKLYKSGILTSYHFPEGKIHEDEFTAHHFLGLCSKIACISDELYYYVQREGSITANYELKNFDAFDAFIDRYRFYKKNGYKDLAIHMLGISACALFLRIRKVHNGKMFTRWIRLMFQYFFLLLVNFKASFILLKPFLDKLLFCIKRHLAWKGVKTAFRRTQGLKQRVILVATPEHGNLGDHAIVYAERQIFEDCGLFKNIIEIPNSVYLRNRKQIQQLVREQDLIVIDGGGNLGTLWSNEDDKITDIIYLFKENKIIIFPQTCYYGNHSESRLKRNRTTYDVAPKAVFTFRDKASFDFARANFPTVQCEYVPDIALSIRDVKGEKKRKGVLLCFRKDCEKVIDEQTVNDIKKYLKNRGVPFTETDTVVQKAVSSKNRNELLHNKWSEFGSAGLVITDRLHGMIFAAITGTSCIAIDNVSQKVSGVYAWIKELPYIRILEQHKDIEESISEMYREIGFDYDFDYPLFFEEEIKKWQI